MKRIRNTTYREYLQDCYEAEKASGKSVSLKAFSSKVGLTESSLRMILAGKRNLTIHNIHIIAKGLKLSRAQLETFEALVLRDQAESAEERLYYARRLSEKTSTYTLTDFRITENSVLKEWFGPALIVYLRENKITSQNLSPEISAMLAQKLGIKVAEVEQAISFLEKGGYLSKDSKRNEHLIFDKVTSANAQMAYIKNCFSQAIRKVETEYKLRKALFSVKCLSISDDKISELGSEYKSLLEKYMSDNEDSEQRSTVQVTFSAIKVF